MIVSRGFGSRSAPSILSAISSASPPKRWGESANARGSASPRRHKAHRTLSRPLRSEWREPPNPQCRSPGATRAPSRGDPKRGLAPGKRDRGPGAKSGMSKHRRDENAATFGGIRTWRGGGRRHRLPHQNRSLWRSLSAQPAAAPAAVSGLRRRTQRRRDRRRRDSGS